MTSARKRLIVVGAFPKAGESRVGGVGFACSSLASGRLAEDYEFVPIVSEGDDIFVRTGLRRLPMVAARMTRLLIEVMRQRGATVMLFASHGNSFLEKGLMGRLAAVLGARVLLLPRSGHLIEQVARGGWFARYVRWALRGAHVVICQSTSWQAYFRTIAGPDVHARFVVVENWLRDAAFVPAEAAMSGSGGVEFRVGFFNRIEPAKGIFDFVDAVALAHQIQPRIRGVIYGDGHTVAELRSRLAERKLDSVIEVAGWLGKEDKVETLRSLDCCLFASHVEGFPNSLLEMLALKVPVVATRVGAVPDVLQDREHGFLVQPKDIQAMASAILAMERDEAMRMQLAERAYQRVCSNNTLRAAEARLTQMIS